MALVCSILDLKSLSLHWARRQSLLPSHTTPELVEIPGTAHPCFALFSNEGLSMFSGVLLRYKPFGWELKGSTLCTGTYGSGSLRQNRDSGLCVSDRFMFPSQQPLSYTERLHLIFTCPWGRHWVPPFLPFRCARSHLGHFSQQPRHHHYNAAISLWHGTWDTTCYDSACTSHGGKDSCQHKDRKRH